jgi:site-specific DNA recombinase
MGPGSVSWLIRLAFLAPEIVKAIIQGNHPPDLTAQTLITRRVDLPLQWQAQKTVPVTNFACSIFSKS